MKSADNPVLESYKSGSLLSEKRSKQFMPRPVQPTLGDVGKRVTDADGRTVRRIERVRLGTAYVRPEPVGVETFKSKLGWSDPDEDTYPLESIAVAAVTDDEVRLREL